jgi:flagellar basal body rod protein FlgC
LLNDNRGKVRQAAKELANKIQPSEPERRTFRRRQLIMRRGQITATAASTVSVRLGDDTSSISGVARLASYTPTVNDWVWVLMWDGDAIVLGKES